MELAVRLYDAIHTSQCRLKVISIIPGEQQFSIVTDDDQDTLEIGVLMDTYLALFKQCHNLQHAELSLWDEYILTVGYLFTTNENHTMILRHWDVVQRLVAERGHQFLDTELDVVSTLIASRLSRINKSSSLWLLVRKLVVQQGLPVLATLSARVMASLRHHFANYYAANFVRWYVAVLLDQGQSISAILEAVVAECHGNLRDVSLWSLLGFMLSPEIDGYVDEYQRLGGSVGKMFNAKKHQMEMQNVAIAQLKWLMLVKCPYENPYVVLRQVVGERVFDQVVPDPVIHATQSAFI